MAAPLQSIYSPVTAQIASPGAPQAQTSLTNPDGSINWGNLLGAGATTGLGLYGANSTAGAQIQGEQNAIGTQQQTLQNVQNQFAPQTTTGNAAFGNLNTYLGLNGQPADFSQFYNTPGYQFATQQGTQAIDRQASANGSLYTPNTLASVGQYVTGAASQNYNNYISQLFNAAGMGAQGNTAISQAQQSTGANISQLQAAQGSANASGAAASNGVLSNLLGSLGGSSGVGGLLNQLLGSSATPGSTNSSGVLSGAGGALNGLGSLFGGGTNGSPSYSDYNPVTGQGNYSGNSLFDQFSNGTGYDPTTGQYDSSAAGGGFDSFAGSQGGYDPVTGNYGNDTNDLFTPSSYNFNDQSSLGGSTF